MVGVAWIACGTVRTLGQFILFYGVLSALGQTALSLATVVVSRWFRPTQRGQAIGLADVGTGVGDLGTENYGNVNALVVGAPDRAGNVLTAGVLENSNVDGTAMLVSMIQYARQFEMQVRVLQNGDENASSDSSGR